jgi:enoyl-CoA hydratase/carnithine racemase
LRKLLLPRQVNELVLTGELISALKAQTMGLVNRVVAQQQLDGEVDRLIEQIIALSPAALKKGQDAIHAMEGMSFEEALAFAESQIALMSTSGHAQEGMAAFNEKRSPQWAQRVKP